MKIVSLGTLFDSRKHKTLVPATRQKVDEGPIALAQFLGSSCGQRKHIQVTFFFSGFICVFYFQQCSSVDYKYLRVSDCWYTLTFTLSGGMKAGTVAELLCQERKEGTEKEI